MAETKEDIAAERDQLRAENEELRRKLRAAMDQAGRQAAPGPVAPQQMFQLSEGDRQELVAHGWLNVGGRLRTRDEVRDMLGGDQRNVDLGDREPDPLPVGIRRDSAVPGVDYVYPSVAPGQIDPKVAGTPGISGPAAGA